MIVLNRKKITVLAKCLILTDDSELIAGSFKIILQMSIEIWKTKCAPNIVHFARVSKFGEKISLYI